MSIEQTIAQIEEDRQFLNALRENAVTIIEPSLIQQLLPKLAEWKDNRWLSKEERAETNLMWENMKAALSNGEDYKVRSKDLRRVHTLKVKAWKATTHT